MFIIYKKYVNNINMEYVKGEPFFYNGKNKIKSFKYLDKSIETDILIIGGGIDGCIANYYLSKKYNVTLVDKERLGASCTSCATALLEYQLDDFAEDLKKELSEDEIVDIYKMGLYSINKIKKFINENGNECFFNLRPSLMYASDIASANNIQIEYDFRAKNGFKCKIITKDNNNFGFEMTKGLYCEDGGCEFDPYLFCKQLIDKSSNQDNIYEYTKINEVKKVDDYYLAVTNYNETIKCKKVIYATGFNWEILHTDDLCDRFITYTIVTSPIKDFEWHKRTLIQDTLDPYHYLRLLPENRIIFGGEDTAFKGKDIDEGVAKSKYKALETKLCKMFPALKDKICIDYKFCGCFGSTDNNLGLMGKTVDPNIMYFFSMGANGIINAMYAVEILDDILSGKTNKLERLFSPTR